MSNPVVIRNSGADVLKSRRLHKDSSFTEANDLVIINPRDTDVFASANFVGLLQKTVIVL